MTWLKKVQKFGRINLNVLQRILLLKCVAY